MKRPARGLKEKSLGEKEYKMNLDFSFVYVFILLIEKEMKKIFECQSLYNHFLFVFSFYFSTNWHWA